jgi:hypothetical protein
MAEADIAMIVTLLNTSTVKEAAAALRVTDRTVRNRRQAVSTSCANWPARPDSSSAALADQPFQMIDERRHRSFDDVEHVRVGTRGAAAGSCRSSSPGMAYGSQRRSNWICSGSTET